MVSDEQVERIVAEAVLMDDDESLRTLVMHGIATVDSLRLKLQWVFTPFTGKERRLNVSCALKYGVRFVVALKPPGAPEFWSPFGVRQRNGRRVSLVEGSPGVEALASALLRRCHNDVGAVTRSLNCLERARLRALEIIEEQTRWQRL